MPVNRIYLSFFKNDFAPTLKYSSRIYKLKVILHYYSQAK